MNRPNDVTVSINRGESSPSQSNGFSRGGTMVEPGGMPQWANPITNNGDSSPHNIKLIGHQTKYFTGA